MKPNLASVVADDSAEDAEAPDSAPGEVEDKDPFTQAAELAFEALQDGDQESFVDALKNAMTLAHSEPDEGPKKKPVLSLKFGGKG